MYKEHIDQTMKISTIGYNYSHDNNFEISRPNGLDCYVMLLVKTPAVFTIGDKSSEVRAGSFIVFAPGISNFYHGTEAVYTDDWVHFDADDEDREYMKTLGIPVNEPVYLGNIDELSEIIHILSYEHYTDETYRADIEEHYLKIFFLKLSRLIKLGTAVSAHSFTESNHRMVRLRTEIFTMTDRKFSVDEMAAEMNMSRSGFQHLYKKMFGVSVTKDMTRGRMERAKRLLSSTNLTVSEIAHRCGYVNGYSFMRKFKEECGQTPTEFRNRI